MRNSKQFYILSISVISIVVLLLYSAGCGQQHAINEEHKEQIRRLVNEAWSKGNMEVVDELFSSDYICHQIPYQDRNLESYKKLWLGFRSSHPGTKCDINIIVAEGDMVTVLATFNGTNKKTGKYVSGPGLILFRWEGDKIIESWDIWDELGYYRQLGYTMLPPLTEYSAKEDPALKSVHLLNLPQGVSDSRIVSALHEINKVISDLGYPAAGYRLWKVNGDITTGYMYLWEGVWPSQAAYDVIHKNEDYLNALSPYEAMFQKVMDDQVYQRYSQVIPATTN
jgi:predicted ester cyclase